MTERLSMLPDMPSPHLPPPDLWLYNPYAEGRIPTPVDDRGLVDMTELIKQTKKTVDPSYSWESGYTDIHHLQWPNAEYAYEPYSPANPHTFRNLAISKLRTPRIFHNWIHTITLPPPMPTAEVMRYRIEAQRVVLALARVVNFCETLSLKDEISEAKLKGRLIENFDEFNEVLEDARSVPREFQLINLANYRPNRIEDMFKITSLIGKAATSATVLPYVRKQGILQIAS